MTRVVPHAITFLGHGFTLAWLLGAPLWIGAVGLLCDAADGLSARRLRVASPYGALYDWTVDVTVCALVMQRLGALPLLLVLVPLQVYAHRAGWHFSGRALASIVLAALTLLGPSQHGEAHVQVKRLRWDDRWWGGEDESYALCVRGPQLHRQLGRMALRDQGMERGAAEQSIREMVFEDKP